MSYEDSILEKNGLAGVRAAYGMYVGEAGAHAIWHLLKEPVDNVVDEYVADRNDRLHLEVRNNGTVIVIDAGIGIPVAKMHAVVSKLHTSGKFKDSGGYQDRSTSGTHGVGLKTVNALSRKFLVATRVDSEAYIREYAFGKFVTEHEDHPVLNAVPSDMYGLWGSCIAYIPDYDLLCEGETILPDIEQLVSHLKALAFLNPGLRVTARLPVDGGYSRFDFCSDNYVEFLENKISELGLTDTPGVVFEYESETCAVCVMLTEQADSFVDYYVNSSVTKHATSLNVVGFKQAWWKALQEFSGKELHVNSATFSMLGFVNAKVQFPVFQGNAKEKLVSKNVDKLLAAELYPVILDFLNENKSFAKSLVAAAQRFSKAQESAAEVAKAKKDYKAKTKNPLASFTRCRVPAEKIEVFLVEGDSAGGSADMMRDRKYQEVHPMRGKFLNAFRAGNAALLKSAATSELISRLFNNLADYENGKLRVGKIILAADPDTDGLHINNLFHAFLWTVIPQAYEQGRVYVADVPLFKVAAKGSVVYAQSLQEAEALLRKQHKRLPPTTVSRFKGLGEMNPKELHRFILNPETRQLRVIQPPVDSNAEQHIRLLLGKDGEYRKTVVAE